jgi:5'-3' exonuclease
MEKNSTFKRKKKLQTDKLTLDCNYEKEDNANECRTLTENKATFVQIEKSFPQFKKKKTEKKHNNNLANTDKFAEMMHSLSKSRLDEMGWKDRYYNQKFNSNTNTQHQTRRLSVSAFVQGIFWIMAYYYEGVPSWTWFYPYHYAPFASDFKHLNKLKTFFKVENPVKPYNQLMGVLPPSSAWIMPLPFSRYLENLESPIIHFYPTLFLLEMNGKRFAWQGLGLLPYIDEKTLFNEIFKTLNHLTGLKKLRNSPNKELFFITIKTKTLNKVVLKQAERFALLPKKTFTHKRIYKYSYSWMGFILPFHCDNHMMTICTLDYLYHNLNENKVSSCLFLSLKQSYSKF